jgi:cell division protein FtsB
MMKQFFKYIETISGDNTYFTCVEAPEKLRFTKDLVRVNFADLCPFDFEDVVFLQEKKLLLLWFIKKRENLTKIPVPVYSLMPFFRNSQDGIKIYEQSDARTVFVMKGGVLRSQLSVPNSRNIEEICDTLRREYSLSSFNNERVLPAPVFRNLIPFIRQDLASRNFKNNMTDYAVKFLIVLFAAFIVTDLAVYSYVSFSKSRSESALLSLRQENRELSAKVMKLVGDRALIDELSFEAAVTYGTVNTLNKIYSSALETGSEIMLAEFSSGRLTLNMVSNSGETLIKSLNKGLPRSDLKLISAAPWPADKSREYVQMELSVSAGGAKDEK